MTPPWRAKGTCSCTETCFDIGIITNAALTRRQRSGDPAAGATDPNTAGNGALMRLAPVAIRFWRDPEALRRVAAIMAAADLGGDADTTAAIAGQLAGALYGASAIPQQWLAKLAWRPRIEVMAQGLIERAGPLAG